MESISVSFSFFLPIKMHGIPHFLSWLLLFLLVCNWSAVHFISAVDRALCKACSLHPSLTPRTSFNEAFRSPSVFPRVKRATVSKIVICFFFTRKPASWNVKFWILLVMRGVNSYFQWLVLSAGNYRTGYNYWVSWCTDQMSVLYPPLSFSELHQNQSESPFRC